MKQGFGGKAALIAIAGLALPGCSDLVGGAYGADQATSGAEFRYHAREAHAGLYPVCAFTENADLLSQYEPLKARMTALEERVGGTALAVDLQGVRADYEYYWSQTPAPCADIDTDETPAMVDGELQRIAGALEVMERAAGMN